MNKKIFVFLILLLIVSFSTQAFASLTFTTDAITGTTASSIDLGAGNALSLQTTGNGAINLGSGLLTSTGSATFSGTVQGLNVYEDIPNTNIAIGSTAFNRNASGTFNIVAGSNTLQNNTTGYSNVGFGHYSLTANTSGNTNSAFGVSALMGNTIGFANTALGYGVLSTNIEANKNTGVGYYVLGYSTSGTLNTAMGSEALYSLTTGSYNTVMGSLAGRVSGSTPVTTNKVTTGSNLTFLGYQSGLGSATQRTNSTAIGNEAYVDADNTVVLGDENVVNIMAGSTGISKVTAGTLHISGLATYADNTAALAGGLVAGDVYRTATGVLMVTY